MFRVLPPRSSFQVTSQPDYLLSESVNAHIFDHMVVVVLWVAENPSTDLEQFVLCAHVHKMSQIIPKEN